MPRNSITAQGPRCLCGAQHMPTSATQSSSVCRRIDRGMRQSRKRTTTTVIGTTKEKTMNMT